MSDKGHTEARVFGHGRDGIDEGDLDGQTDGPAGHGAQGSEKSPELDQFDAIGRELAKMMRQASESAEQIRAEAVAEAERTLARAELAVGTRLRAADDEADLRRQALEAELEPTRAEARASLDEARSLLQQAQDVDQMTRAKAAVVLESAATRRAAVDEASTSLAALLAAVDETIAGWHANAATTREAIARVSSDLHEVVDQPDPGLLLDELFVEDLEPTADLVDLTDDEGTIDLRDPDVRYADLPAPPAGFGAHVELATSEVTSPGADEPEADEIEAQHVEAEPDADDDEALRATVRTAVSRTVEQFMTDISSAR